MLLTSVAAVRDPLGFDDMGDINAAIEQALQAVEPQLVSPARHPLRARHGHRPVLGALPSVEQGRHRMTEFALRRGFLVAPPTVVTREAPREPVLLDLSLTVDYDLERGVVRDIGTPFQEVYVEVSYTAGFEAAPGGQSYDLTQVPTWLQRAATVKALRLLASNPAVTEAGVELDIEVLDHQYAALINSRIRYTRPRCCRSDGGAVRHLGQLSGPAL